MSDNKLAVQIRDVTKTFEDGRVYALDGVNLDVQSGEWIALIGPSGCGKSTLLHLIAALDFPSSGYIKVNGVNLATERNISRHRAREIGLVFQLDNLIPTLTATENVQVPMFELGIGASERKRRAGELLRLVDLADKETKRPSQLSGGERQRVAVARALANQPAILLADEPTGRLDSTTGRRILDLLEQLKRERGLTIILVTHDPLVAARADRIVRMLDGRIASEDTPLVPPSLAHRLLAGV
jgi:putative ABC transport system ATP-binding protein